MDGDGRLRRLAVGDDRTPFLPLLELADDAHDHVVAHLGDGDLYVWSDGEEAIGAVQVVPRTDGVELTLVAIAEHRQGQGEGLRMLAALHDQLRAQGVTVAVVGTATAGVGQIAFYQRAGYRPLSIERDHFDAARGYDGTETENGLPIRDLIWFDQTFD